MPGTGGGGLCSIRKRRFSLGISSLGPEDVDLESIKKGSTYFPGLETWLWMRGSASPKDREISTEPRMIIKPRFQYCGCDRESNESNPGDVLHADLGFTSIWGLGWLFKRGTKREQPIWIVPFEKHMAMVQNQWYHFGIGECTAHSRLPILVIGLGPVHWGLTDLGFAPWPSPFGHSIAGRAAGWLGAEEAHCRLAARRPPSPGPTAWL